MRRYDDKRSDSELADGIWPFILRRLRRTAEGVTILTQVVAETAAHTLSGSHHTGTLSDSQAPQFLKVDGSRGLTGNLAVSAGVTIDTVDISAHAANPAAHHDPVTVGNTGLSLSNQQLSLNLAALSGLLIDSGLKINVGNGLTIATNALAVNLATNSGLTLAGGPLAMGAPANLSVTSANGVSGSNHAHAILSSDNPSGWPEVPEGSGRRALLATNTKGEMRMRAIYSHAPFTSGFTGSGYELGFDLDPADPLKAHLELDNLTVRGRMRVYELLIQQIRATNGSVFVSSSSTAEHIDDESDWEFETGGVTVRRQFETDGTTVDAEYDTNLYIIDTRTGDEADNQTYRELYHGFLVGDAIRYQQVQWSEQGEFQGVRRVDLLVTGVDNLYRYRAIKVAGDDPQPGDDFVRLGSQDSARRGTVYLTADDSHAPYIDVVDGVITHSDWNTPGKVRVRLGKLTGISDIAFGGQLQGYGLYADNVYLKGKIVITGGSGYSSLTDKPTSLADINAGEGSKLGGIAAGATVGATWGINLSSIPAHLSTPSTTGLYLTADYVGYWQSGNPGSFKSYLDKNGNFQLGDISSGAGLAWNQAGGTLMIRGGAAIVGGQAIGTPAVAGLYLGSDVMGYYSPTYGWTAYISSNGSFRAGRNGVNDPYIYWNAAGSGELEIKGKITATSGSNVVQTGGAAGDVNANTTTIDGGKITTNTITATQIAAGTITATQIAAGTITATQIASNAITSDKIFAGAVTAAKIAVDGNISISSNGAIYSGKAGYSQTTAGWWIGRDASDSVPKFHFGDANYYIRWTGTDLEINRPNLKGSWVAVGSGGLSYGTGWGTYGYSNDLRYVRVGDFVWVMGWVRANNTSNNAIIATGLPAPAQSFYTGVRSSRPPTPYESSQPNSSGDVVYVENNSGSGRLVFFGYLSLPGNSYNIDLILNFVYRAA